MNRCANCSAVIRDKAGRLINGAWLDDYCLDTLTNRGFLVGKNGPGGDRTWLSFMRNGKLMAYLAPSNYYWDFPPYSSIANTKAMLKMLDDSQLVPFPGLNHPGKPGEGD